MAQLISQLSSNTVAYSLMSACAVCQNGTYPDFLSWTTNCPSALVEYQGYVHRKQFLLQLTLNLLSQLSQSNV